MYAYCAKYDAATNRREAFTLPMLEEAISRAKFAPWQDHITQCLADWYILGLAAGLRKVEWAQQKDTQIDPEHPGLNIFGDAYAFCMRDLMVVTKDGRRLCGFRILDVPVTQWAKIWPQFYTQKNGENGQWRMFVPLPECPAKCVGRAVYRIAQRFVCLRSKTNDKSPLGIHKADRYGHVHLITPTLIFTHMCSIASKLHKLHPTKNKAELRRWSSHSLRVGACILLHKRGYSQTQIKFLLRWRSDGFMVYLWNVMSLAKRHSRSLLPDSTGPAMPCIVL